MKLWQVKAQALRIMFADTGNTFSEEEFSEGILMENGNVRSYLVGMDDTIRRGIDMYYQYVGEPTRRKVVYLKEASGAYLNELDLSTIEDFGYPTRIDYEIYNEYDGTKMLTARQIDFTFDQVDNSIYFTEEDYIENGLLIQFIVWYKVNKSNVPDDPDQMTFDLTSINIPENVQRMLPYYVKGELFEEDEPELANQALGRYIGFLRSLKKPFSKVQTKVKKSNVFNKTN